MPPGKSLAGRFLTTAPPGKSPEEIFEAIMTENFPRLMSDVKPHIQDAQRTPSRINPTKKLYVGLSLSHYRISKMKMPKEVRGKKHCIYRATQIRITSDFSETMQARRECYETFNVLREKCHQPRILYPAKYPSKEVKEK